MKRIVYLVLISIFSLIFFACQSEDYERFYPQPTPETPSELIEVKRIFTWETNPENKRFIGYLERYQKAFKGIKQPYIFYYICDVGYNRIGFIDTYGKFYKYTKSGALEEFGEYPIQPTGLKMFFNLPLSNSVTLISI